MIALLSLATTIRPLAPAPIRLRTSVICLPESPSALVGDRAFRPAASAAATVWSCRITWNCENRNGEEYPMVSPAAYPAPALAITRSRCRRSDRSAAEQLPHGRPSLSLSWNFRRVIEVQIDLRARARSVASGKDAALQESRRDASETIGIGRRSTRQHGKINRFALHRCPARRGDRRAMAGLDGKLAVVTGASRGYGRAIAERLARDGARRRRPLRGRTMRRRRQRSHRSRRTAGRRFPCARRSTGSLASVVDALRAARRGACRARPRDRPSTSSSTTPRSARAERSRTHRRRSSTK